VKVVEISKPGGPEVLRIGEREKPAPADGEVLIRVEAAGVSRADAMQRLGVYPPPPGAPDIPGLECAGTIESVGRGVRDWKPGDRVCALLAGGGYAEYAVAAGEQVLPIPEGWTSVEAATLPENGFTAYENLFLRARLKAGESVLIHAGTSGVGSTAIMFAKALGISPIFTTAGSPQKCAAAQRFGADAAIDYKTQDFVTRVREATHDRGVDVIFDLVGGPYVARDLDAVALDGRIVCIATMGGREIALDLGKMLARRAAVFGSSLRGRTPREKGAIRDELLRVIWPLLPEKSVIRPIVDGTFPLEQASVAHERLESGAHVGKIVLTV
jgi:putative PIG3 family NAD(P)H quinone oxidoreductase